MTTIIVYALTFMTPTFIVKWYSRFVDPMSASEERMAIMAGTGAMLILAAITGFSGNYSVTKSLARQYKNVKVAGKDTIIVKDPGAHGAETMFKWNQKEKLWESDHGTYLDEDHMKEWLSQRGSDRQWADRQMKNLKERNTAFDRDLRRKK